MGLTFYADLRDSQQRENRFANALQQKGFITTTSRDLECFPDWDVQGFYPPTSKTLTFEIKLDRYYGNRSENVAVEVAKTISGSTQPCGVMTSKANFYVYTFEGPEHQGKYYVIDTTTLKNIYLTCGWERMVQTQDGPHSVYTNMLISGADFINKCKILEE